MQTLFLLKTIFQVKHRQKKIIFKNIANVAMYSLQL